MVAENNPVFGRLEKQQQQISTMLPSWLMGMIKHRVNKSNEKGHSSAAGVKDLLITQKQPIYTRNASVLRTDRFTSFEKMVLQKYQLARDFSSSIAGFSRDAKSWGEIDRIFPSQSSKVQEERAQPGEMKRGTVIQPMVKLPKIADAAPVSKPKSEVVDKQRLRQAKAPTKIDITPGQRLFTHVREITGTRPPVTEEKEQPTTDTDTDLPVLPKPDEILETSAERPGNDKEDIALPGLIEPEVPEKEAISKRQDIPQQPRQETVLPVVSLRPQVKQEPTKDLPVALPVKKPVVEKAPLSRAKPVESSRKILAAPPVIRPSTRQSVQRQIDSEDSSSVKSSGAQHTIDTPVQPLPEVPKLAQEKPLIPASKLIVHEQTNQQKDGSTPVDSEPYRMQPDLLQRNENRIDLVHTDTNPRAILKTPSNNPQASQPPIIRRDKYHFTVSPLSNIVQDNENITSKPDVQEQRYAPVVPTPRLQLGNIEESLPQPTSSANTNQTSLDLKPTPISPSAQPHPWQPVLKHQSHDSENIAKVVSDSDSGLDLPEEKLLMPLKMEIPRQQVNTNQQEQVLSPTRQVFEPLQPTKKEDTVFSNETKVRQPAKTSESGNLSAVKTSASPAVVQRSMETTPDAVPQDIDYDRLAEDVFPYIKHLIEIERERSLGR